MNFVFLLVQAPSMIICLILKPMLKYINNLIEKLEIKVYLTLRTL